MNVLIASFFRTFHSFIFLDAVSSVSESGRIRMAVMFSFPVFHLLETKQLDVKIDFYYNNSYKENAWCLQ